MDEKIAAVCMVKNESKRIHVTLNSIATQVDGLIIFDTGSTDNTVEIITEFASKHNIPLHLKRGSFVDFSTSRNEMLDFADTFDYDFYLLLDCNDEVRGDLRTYLKNDIADRLQKCQPLPDGYLCIQEWWSGTTNRYFNVRLIRSRRSMRYIGKVHEYLEQSDFFITKFNPTATTEPVIFQDRTQDDDKTGKRFFRDKEMLLEAYKEDPSNARTTFYLAQTCSCLDQKQEAYNYYEIRSKQGDFYEEVFHSMLRCGDFAFEIGMEPEVGIGWYLKAYTHSTLSACSSRVEPLLKLAEHYRSKSKWNLSFQFVDLACKLQMPEYILFLDKEDYEYKRWHLMGIVAFYADKELPSRYVLERGKEGCLKAISSGRTCELDMSNLKFYLSDVVPCVLPDIPPCVLPDVVDVPRPDVVDVPREPCVLPDVVDVPRPDVVEVPREPCVLPDVVPCEPQQEPIDRLVEVESDDEERENRFIQVVRKNHKKIRNPLN
jgi:glycosyltransferase involved in cell wall biosynthesis